MKPIVIGDSKKLLAEAAAREHAKRRERIATAAMNGILASGLPTGEYTPTEAAIRCADALIAELDNERSPDDADGPDGAIRPDLGETS